MRKLQPFVLATLIFFSSCTRQEVIVPADVISRDSMVTLLTDIHLVEATIQLKNLGSSDSLKAEAYGRYKYVFNKHHVTVQSFRKSLDFYRKQPEYFQKMYDEVLVRLSEEQARFGRIK